MSEHVEYCHIEYRVGERGPFGPISLFVVDGQRIGGVDSFIYAARIVHAYNEWADRENAKGREVSGG